ncbi:MAG TPA: sugar ABC transporter ATP-binding protein [Acidimicrobiales bacterium]|nr:sugar ABC transporter ATP-binding protein [Acidimicrobiales bacterium]
MANEDVPAAEAIGISKQFGSTVALRGVSVSLRSGRCLGLVGRNGAGKSTLVSIMSGIYGADRGEVRFEGQPAPALGDVQAWRERISTVFQHSMVVPQLTVAENVFLNTQPARSGFLDWRTMRAEAKQVLAEWGFGNVNANALCSTLTVEQRQLVEIARALAAGRRCLLLDEPTSALERAEIQRLFERVRSMVANGVAVLYISHHLEEVFEVCDDVAVLRDGELVMSRPTAGLSQDELVTAMVGQDTATIAGIERPGAKDNGQRADHGKPCLVVEHLAASSPRGALRDVSLEVRHGERVALLGSLGAGVATLARAAAGCESWSSGRIEVEGELIVPLRRDKALKAGVGYVPEDRRTEGFVRLLGVGENATMSIVDRLANAIGAVMPKRRAAAARPLAERLSIVSASMSQPLGELSGGNQQKVTVARAVAIKPKLVVAMTPTRGVDVASKAVLLATLSSLALDDGAAVLIATDDLDDLVICDRVVVLRRGEVVAEFTEPPFDREELIGAIEGLVPSGSVTA